MPPSRCDGLSQFKKRTQVNPLVPTREFNLIACRNLTRHAGVMSRTHTVELASQACTAAQGQRISPLSHEGRWVWWAIQLSLNYIYLSLSLVVKEILKSMNAWQNYMPKNWLPCVPCRLAMSQLKRWWTGHITYLWQKETAFAFVMLLQIIFDFSVNKYQTNKYFSRTFWVVEFLHRSLLAVFEQGDFTR